MRSGKLLLSYLRLFSFAMSVLFVVSASVVSAAPADTGGTDIDIPISELNKVKKTTPSKRVTKESKKKKKNDAKPQESSPKTAVEPAGQPKTPPAEPDTAGQGGTVLQKLPAASNENIRIHHAPYSFVVADKRTVIYAVIDSKADIKEVTCSVRVAENGATAPVKMEKVAGSQFTYTADLPPLPPGISALRYTIDAVNSQGEKNRSREFVTPVTSSPVVPDWQTERANDALPAGSKKPGTAVSDPGVTR